MILFPPLVWVMKREILWIPFVGWGCMLAQCIAIDRKAGAAAVNQVLAQGKDRMERLGAWVLVFPEGTRMAPGETRRYGSSGTLLAAQEGCKIVPVAHNAGYFWPRRGLLKKRGTIRVDHRAAHRSRRPRRARGQRRSADLDRAPRRYPGRWTGAEMTRGRVTKLHADASDFLDSLAESPSVKRTD